MRRLELWIFDMTPQGHSPTTRNATTLERNFFEPDSEPIEDSHRAAQQQAANSELPRACSLLKGGSEGT
jgi:hypothetical protein